MTTSPVHPSLRTTDGMLLVARAVEAAMSVDYNINACIAATAITIDALATFGIRAEPCPVKLLALNAAALKLTTAGVRQAERPDQWASSGALVVAIGCGNRPARPGDAAWDGHLVAWVENTWLVDPSAGQVTHQSVNGGPVAFEAPPLFRRGGGMAPYMYGATALLYERNPRNRSYERTPHWQASPTRSAVCAIAAKLIKAGIPKLPANPG